jgi:hypothetical protein
VIIGVCDTDPVTAGLIAHYLAVALDVLVRTEGIEASVGVLEPYTLTDPRQIRAIGEAPTFDVISVDADAAAFVSLNGFGSAQVERRFVQDGVANVCLTEYLDGRHADDTVALADACVTLARDLATCFAAS